MHTIMCEKNVLNIQFTVNTLIKCSNNSRYLSSLWVTTFVYSFYQLN